MPGGPTIKHLRHVVFFKYQSDLAQQKVEELRRSFVQLAQKIDLIQNVEWGLNNSPENLNHGYTDCFILSFLSEQDLKNYLVHPVHVEFVEEYRSMIEDVCVLDFWPQ